MSVLFLAFVEQSLCDKIEEVCTIDDNDKKVSVIYQVDQKIYLCIILPQFNTDNAGVLISKVSTLSMFCPAIL